ncbi:hypothetical protein F66182_869 [Fusarium sp. NRRL 66182]|nr:hypothetical protein F66182_869 [Fusarium sp. NRRL 66182]
MAAVEAGQFFSDIFSGNLDVGTRLTSFDFGRINIQDAPSDEYLHIDLAPAWGLLGRASVQSVDDQIKIMVAGTMKSLRHRTDENWNAVLSAMMRSMLLEPSENEIFRADKLIKDNSRDFKFHSSSNVDTISEVKSWIDHLVSDDDVIQSTKIDQVIPQIVAQICATIKSLQSFSDKCEHYEQTLLDVGVLRFPDIDHPFFKLYRIKLIAWSDSSRVVYHYEDRSGIAGGKSFPQVVVKYRAC